MAANLVIDTRNATRRVVRNRRKNRAFALACMTSSADEIRRQLGIARVNNFFQRISAGSRNSRRSPHGPCAAASSFRLFFRERVSASDASASCCRLVCGFDGTLLSPGGSGAHPETRRIDSAATTTDSTDFFSRQIESLVASQRYSCGAFDSAIAPTSFSGSGSRAQSRRVPRGFTWETGGHSLSKVDIFS